MMTVLLIVFIGVLIVDRLLDIGQKVGPQMWRSLRRRSYDLRYRIRRFRWNVKARFVLRTKQGKRLRRAAELQIRRDGWAK